MTKTPRPTHTRAMSVGAALGTAAALLIGSLGFGGLNSASAEKSDGDRPVFISIVPCRVTDTRPSKGVGGRTTPVSAAETLDVDVRPTSGDCMNKIPSDALAVQLNVTAIQATEVTYLTVHPTGSTRPQASSLNPAPGQPPTPNAVTTAISSSGEFSIYNDAGDVHVLVDISGYYVSHNHDDDRPDRVYIGGTDFVGLGSSNVEYNPSAVVFPAALSQCITAHLPIPDGAAVSGASISATSSSAADLDLTLVAVRTAPGTALVPADYHEELATGTMSIAGATELEQGVLTPASPVVIDLASRGVYLEVCSDDVFAVTGASIGLVYS